MMGRATAGAVGTALGIVIAWALPACPPQYQLATSTVAALLLGALLGAWLLERSTSWPGRAVIGAMLGALLPVSVAGLHAPRVSLLAVDAGAGPATSVPALVLPATGLLLGYFLCAGHRPATTTAPSSGPTSPPEGSSTSAH
jgi:hypothetical protein